MPIYRTKFERLNFDFDPPLKQTADVVFSCDAPNDDEHYGIIKGAAWDAMWEQNPHWHKSESPLPGYAGWSSVLGGHEFEEVKDENLDFDLGTPGDSPVPRIAEIFEKDDLNGKPRRYRVQGFYKTYTPKKLKPDPVLDSIIQDILDEEDPEKKARRAEMLKVIPCAREEAEFVSGAGVAGTICRIEDIRVIGLAQWEPRTIARHRRDYARTLERRADDFPTEIYKYWERESVNSD